MKTKEKQMNIINQCKGNLKEKINEGYNRN